MDYIVFGVLFFITIGSACIVAFSQNLIYSAFALIGTFIGVSGTFVFLHADFLGLAQIMVYAGGILVLTIFAVMLTSKIDKKDRSNPVLNYKAVVPLMLLLVLLLGRVVSTDMWATTSEVIAKPTAQEIGNQLLSNYLLPFELISVLLLMAMVGAAIITRRHVKE
jgi:NADH:ubiquinone oxidoreductase subunit 6 (subunit J)